MSFRTFAVSALALAALATPVAARNPGGLSTVEYGASGCPGGWALVAIHAQKGVHICVNLAGVATGDTHSIMPHGPDGTALAPRLLPDGAGPVSDYPAAQQHAYDDITVSGGAAVAVTYRMLACAPGGYARRINSDGTEVLCSFGPVSDLRPQWSYIDGLHSLSTGATPAFAQTTTQWQMSDGDTAHGCDFRGELNVIVGIHDAQNQLLCAPLRPLVLP